MLLGKSPVIIEHNLCKGLLSAVVLLAESVGMVRILLGNIVACSRILLVQIEFLTEYLVAVLTEIVAEHSLCAKTLQHISSCTEIV